MRGEVLDLEISPIILFCGEMHEFGSICFRGC